METRSKEFSNNGGSRFQALLKETLNDALDDSQQANIEIPGNGEEEANLRSNPSQHQDYLESIKNPKGNLNLVHRKNKTSNKKKRKFSKRTWS